MPEAKGTPKKVDVHLPGPSPRRSASRRGSDVASIKPPSKSKKPHSRKSSVASLQRSALDITVDDSTEANGATEQAVDAAANSDDDENGSVGESSNGVRVRRSEAARIQVYKDHPDCDEFEATRAHCSRCDKWISLGKRSAYSLRPWEMHRSSCDKRPPKEKKDQPATSPLSKTTPPATENGETEAAPSPSANEVPEPTPTPAESVTSKPTPPPEGKGLSPSAARDDTPSKAARKNESQRRAELENDPRAEEVRPNEVLCKGCNKWIKLSSTTAYSLGNWNVHQQRCTGASTNSRVATTERKIKLLNDPQAKSCTPRSVECVICRETVHLESPVDYDLAKWEEHKIDCQLTSPLARSTSFAKTPMGDRSWISQGSMDKLNSWGSPMVLGKPAFQGTWSQEPNGISASTLQTPFLQTPQTSKKRAREDEGEGETEEGPGSANRPRKESYEAPQAEAPSPWGWFMQPFKAFVQGFREGLGLSDSVPASTSRDALSPLDAID
ncbi:hypothetical protein CONPUDRAFT_107817 [Coniophora puteana RWD-64-598 SS2]|uniref:Uncharacterized protein n=1 Tax=Coniophora puteana (strain RWD-64-598) TaxID=741705 RepID=A0A5M3MJK2_CONPW|nr:uncharacterized protein CONPUDRAFT_107817 [Coniophora puteana RWD-64-598 SS2]EIW79429.1 hypothetical protein CONPUDRAFT_107817 [Coniophora puteana RWD-64-598 SS2]